jgi:hypothetical protein
VRQRGLYQVGVRRHRFAFDDARRTVHRDDLVETRKVDSRPRARCAVAKEVGGVLGEAYRVVAALAQFGAQARELLAVDCRWRVNPDSCTGDRASTPRYWNPRD